MNNYDYNSIVSRSEAEALKDMIFKRARERAEALTKQTQDSYTTSVQMDVMEIARDSFVATSKNPFAQLAQPEVQEKQTIDEAPVEKEYDGIGFKQRNTENVKNQINYKNKTINENVAQTEVTANMLQARNEFGSRKNFMGALNFLNAQASLSIVNKKVKGFDAVA